MTLLGSLSDRERRVMLAGVVVLGVGLACLRVEPAWRRWTDASRESAVGAVSALDQARASVRTLPVTRDSLTARNARYLALAPAILSGRTPGAVGASLAAVVSGAATGAGLEVGTITIRPDTSRGALFTRPSVRGDARGDIAGLTRFLVALERGPLIFVVRQLTVSQPEPGAPMDRAESLRIEFVVEAIGLERDAAEDRHATTSTRGPRQRPTGDRAP